MSTRRLFVAVIWILVVTVACSSPDEAPSDEASSSEGDLAPRLEEVATSDRQWTGITMAADGGEERLFVNYPRWSDDVPVSVAELKPSGDGYDPVPFPNEEWNSWSPGDDPSQSFVCVQSVIAAGGSLWALDPANPRFEGVVEGGAKLVRFSLADGSLEDVFSLGDEFVRESSYLNDVRFDLQPELAREIAYITDSGDGAILVLDLASGEVRRLLDDHPSTEADDVTLTIGGAPWLRDGATPKIHADGIALTADREWLYFQPLTGRDLFRVPTEVLRSALDVPAAEVDHDALAASVETVGKTGSADGILFGPDGALYLTSLEHDAIRRLLPSGDVEFVVQGDEIAWPDTLTAGPDGSIYFTTAQIHRGPNPPEPYRIFRIANLQDAEDGSR